MQKLNKYLLIFTIPKTVKTNLIIYTYTYDEALFLIQMYIEKSIIFITTFTNYMIKISIEMIALRYECCKLTATF